MKCEYGCNQEAKYQILNKWCCSKDVNDCPAIVIKSIISLKKHKSKLSCQSKKLLNHLKKKLKTYTNISISKIWTNLEKQLKLKEQNKNKNKVSFKKLHKQLQHNNDYQIYLNSPEWKEKSKLIKERDNYTCQKCYSTNKELNVHHKTYERIFHELLEDLTTLCRDCHKNEHNIEEKTYG